MSPDPSDTRVVQLLRDVPLPDLSPDLHARVADRHRTDTRRRWSVVGAVLAVVLVSGSLVTLQLRPEPSSSSSLASVLGPPAGSAHLVLEGTRPSSEGGGSFRQEGDVDLTTGDVSYTAVVTVDGRETSQEWRQIGRDVWVRARGAVTWTHLRLRRAQSGFDPAAQVQKLRAGGGSLARLGREVVAGQRVTRYAVTSPEGSAFTEDPSDRVEIGVDDQGRLVRAEVRGATSYTMTLSRFGEAVDIAPPSAATVVEACTQAQQEAQRDLATICAGSTGPAGSG